MPAKSSEFPLPFASLLLIAPFFFWGTAMVAMKGVMPQSTPLFMAGVRLVPAGGLVLVAAMIAGRAQPRSWAAWLWIALFALVDGTLFQGFLAEGLARTGAGLGSVMIDSQPLAVALLALWIFGEQIGFLGWVGLGLGIVGISLLGLPQEWVLAWLQGSANFAGAGFSTPLIHQLFQNGQWLMLLAALSMALGTIISRLASRYIDPIVATGWHMILGGIPLFLLSAQRETEQWAHLGISDWVALSYSTVFGSAIAYGLFFYFASSGSLTSLSSLTFLTPIFALVFGNLFLGEVLAPWQWLGVGLTLVSIYLINQREDLAAKLQSITQGAAGQVEEISATASGLSSASDSKINSITQVALQRIEPNSDIFQEPSTRN